MIDKTHLNSPKPHPIPVQTTPTSVYAFPSPSALSLISIQSNWPFLSPTTSPKLVQWFLVMLTLSNFIFCPIGPRPLPNALGSFPVPSLMLPDWYLALTTSPKPYRPSPVFLTYADLPEPISTLIVCYLNTSGSLFHVYSVYGNSDQAYLILSDTSWLPQVLSRFPWLNSLPIKCYCNSCISKTAFLGYRHHRPHDSWTDLYSLYKLINSVQLCRCLTTNILATLLLHIFGNQHYTTNTIQHLIVDTTHCW